MSARFPSVLDAVIKTIDWVTVLIGKMAAWGCLAMVLVMGSVVVLRYGFAQSSIALQETATYFHAIVFLLGAAFTLKANEHVRVDIFYQRCSAKTQAWIDLLGYLFFLAPVCLFILIISVDYVALSWRVQEASREAGGLQGVYWLKSLLLVMPVLLLWQGLAECLRAVKCLLTEQQVADGSGANHA